MDSVLTSRMGQFLGLDDRLLRPFSSYLRQRKDTMPIANLVEFTFGYQESEIPQYGDRQRWCKSREEW